MFDYAFNNPKSGGSMNTGVQRACAWCGPLMMVLMLAGLAIAGFIPPPSPGSSASQIAHLFRAHATSIRVGICLTMLGAALLGPFVAAIAIHLKRIKGTGPMLAYVQLALGA